MIAGLVQQPPCSLEETHGVTTWQQRFTRIFDNELPKSRSGAVQSSGNKRRPFGRIRQQ